MQRATKPSGADSDQKHVGSSVTWDSWSSICYLFLYGYIFGLCCS